MAPEVTVSNLWKWANTDYATNITPPMPKEVERYAQQRIDLSLFTPQDANKEDQGLWGLVEFKRRGTVDSDYEKLTNLLPLLDGSFGAACGVVDAETERDWLTTEAPRAHRRSPGDSDFTGILAASRPAEPRVTRTLPAFGYAAEPVAPLRSEPFLDQGYPPPSSLACRGVAISHWRPTRGMNIAVLRGAIFRWRGGLAEADPAVRADR